MAAIMINHLQPSHLLSGFHGSLVLRHGSGPQRLSVGVVLQRVEPQERRESLDHPELFLLLLRDESQELLMDSSDGQDLLKPLRQLLQVLTFAGVTFPGVWCVPEGGSRDLMRIFQAFSNSYFLQKELCYILIAIYSFQMQCIVTLVQTFISNLATFSCLYWDMTQILCMTKHFTGMSTRTQCYHREVKTTTFSHKCMDRWKCTYNVCI